MFAKNSKLYPWNLCKSLKKKDATMLNMQERLFFQIILGETQQKRLIITFVSAF